MSFRFQPKWVEVTVERIEAPRLDYLGQIEQNNENSIVLERLRSQLPTTNVSLNTTNSTRSTPCGAQLSLVVSFWLC